MTTCPNCRRPLVTRDEAMALGPLAPAIDGGRCARVDLGDGSHVYDAWCGMLAADLAKRDEAALLADARCIPRRALRELARVLTFGGEKHGCAAGQPGGGQTADDHIEHARQHLLTARSARLDLPDPPPATDADTGALHLVHAAARALLAAELVMAGEDTGK